VGSAASGDDCADDPKEREDEPDDEHHPVAFAKALDAEEDEQHDPEDTG
jgi:hypothetical protein